MRRGEGAVLDLARQRVSMLFRLAAEAAESGEYEWSRRYAALALRLAEAVRLRMPRLMKRRICKNCGVVLIPGVTARVRTRNRGRHLRISITCLVCGYIHRLEFRRVGKRVEAEKMGAGAEEEEGGPEQG